MTIQTMINATSLQRSGQTATHSAGNMRRTYEVGSVVVTLDGTSRTMPCRLLADGIFVEGLVGHIRKGGKPYDAWVALRPDGSELVMFGGTGRYRAKGRAERISFADTSE